MSLSTDSILGTEVVPLIGKLTLNVQDKLTGSHVASIVDEPVGDLVGSEGEVLPGVEILLRSVDPISVCSCGLVPRCLDLALTLRYVAC